MIKLIVAALCFIGIVYGLPGGWSDVAANSENASKLIEIAIEHRNNQNGDLYYRGLVSVKSIRQQVVAGIKYEVTMILGETHCAKSDAGAKLCQVPANVSIYIYIMITFQCQT